MGFSVGNENEVKSEPNVVPLCDVLLVLLIIFMVVTPLVQRGVDVQLPTALNTISMPDNPEVILYIKRDGTLYINQDQVTMDTLQTTLEETLMMATDKKLYLKADEELNFGKIVDIILVVQTAGVDIVGIITEVKTTEEGG
ncbi:MAG: biopolymer transporter ExbD [Candidatus Aminicenantes bacterium]|nr:biopolymer transporter ExbD [Candidatus Aminicenantes bacterium]